MSPAFVPKNNKTLIESILTLGELTDDRAIAVMAGAVVEYFLSAAILARIVELDADDQERVFDSNGPLATFSEKIWIGYMLKLYMKGAREDLKLIKDIRNVFAHELEAHKFSDERITKLCRRLTGPKHLAEVVMRDQTTDPKERFLETSHHFASGLSLASMQKIRPVPPMTFQY